MAGWDIFYLPINFTFLSVHFFHLVLIILRIILVPPILSCHVVHYLWRRNKGRSLVLTKNCFALPWIKSSWLFCQNYAVTRVVTVVWTVIFCAGDGGSQFDKVLTRDAPNVCYFLHPLREGNTRETYIRLLFMSSIRFSTSN